MASCASSLAFGVPMFAHSSPFLVVPQQQQQHQYSLYQTTSFPHTHPHTHPPPASSGSGPHPSTPTLNPNATPLVPLAHKHAHHLHTIPPRQKSTRTLILDHMLWLHARTRFSQARAELGLLDLDSDDHDNAEDADGRREALMASLRYGSAQLPMEDPGVEEMSRADHVQARALRQKADGLEKVLSAIMDQCSEPLPQCSRPRSLDLGLPTPSSPPRDRQRVQLDPYILPNGVRVRLAVGALINILFSRSDDPLSLDSTTSVPRAPSSIDTSSIPSSVLPLCLTATGSASAYAQVVANGQTHSTPTIFNLDTISQPLDVASWAHHTAESSRGSSSPTEFLTISRASGRSKDLYACGVQAPTPLSLLPESIHHSVRLPIRCTRHLVLSCRTCPIRSSSTTSIGSGLSRRPNGRPFRKAVPDAERANGNQKSIDVPHSHPSSAPHSRLVDLIPLFLQLSALVAIELANESRTSHPCTKSTSNSSVTTTETSEPGSPHLFPDSPYIPMDIVHSLEGGGSCDSRTMSKDGDPPSTPKKERRRTFPFSSLIGSGPAGTPYRDTSPVSSHVPTAPASVIPRYHRRAGPTREWYALLASLLTRAVLEGYLLKGWKGTFAAETLLSLGLSDGLRREKLGEKEVSNGFEPVEGELPVVNRLDPDGLPSVLEAGRILFGEDGAIVKETGPTVELTAKEEFALEMHRRMNEFLFVPSDTPSLTAHLETLSQRYGAEPVEHAALRFLEAVETWRGNPELETYKRNTTSHLLAHSRTSPPVLSPSPSLASIPQSTPPGAERAHEPPDSMPSTDRSPTPPSTYSTPPGTLSTTDASQLQAIDQYFTVCLSKPKKPSPQSPTVAKKRKSGAGERWSIISLGSKRPRDTSSGQDADDSTTQVEEERSSKKINIACTA